MGTTNTLPVFMQWLTGVAAIISPLLIFWFIYRDKSLIKENIELKYVNAQLQKKILQDQKLTQELKEKTILLEGKVEYYQANEDKAKSEYKYDSRTGVYWKGGDRSTAYCPVCLDKDRKYTKMKTERQAWFCHIHIDQPFSNPDFHFPNEISEGSY